MNLRIFHHYFSVEKEDKFLVGQKTKKAYFLSILSLAENQNKYYITFRSFVFEEFVKTCCELDL